MKILVEMEDDNALVRDDALMVDRYGGCWPIAYLITRPDMLQQEVFAKRLSGFRSEKLI